MFIPFYFVLLSEFFVYNFLVLFTFEINSHFNEEIEMVYDAEILI